MSTGDTCDTKLPNPVAGVGVDYSTQEEWRAKEAERIDEKAKAEEKRRAQEAEEERRRRDDETAKKQAEEAEELKQEKAKIEEDY